MKGEIPPPGPSGGSFEARETGPPRPSAGPGRRSAGATNEAIPERKTGAGSIPSWASGAEPGGRGARQSGWSADPGWLADSDLHPRLTQAPTRSVKGRPGLFSGGNLRFKDGTGAVFAKTTFSNFPFASRRHVRRKSPIRSSGWKNNSAARCTRCGEARLPTGGIASAMNSTPRETSSG